MVAAGPERHEGACLCGAVRFETRGLADIWYCHCRQCRYLSGHHVAAAAVMKENLNMQGSLRWAAFSKTAEYAFCSGCGTSLFWRGINAKLISVFAGALLNTDGLNVKGHIFVCEKGAYYEIADNLPQFEYRPEGELREQMMSHG